MKELHRPAFLWMPKAMLREAKSWRKQTIPHTKLKIKQNKIDHRLLRLIIFLFIVVISCGIACLRAINTLQMRIYLQVHNAIE